MAMIEPTATETRGPGSTPAANQSLQWHQAEEVADMMAGIEDLGIEIWFLLGHLSQLDSTIPLSLVMDSAWGSAYFVEDNCGRVWLTRCRKNAQPVPARCLALNDETAAIADLCYETLAGTSMHLPVAAHLH